MPEDLKGDLRKFLVSNFMLDAERARFGDGDSLLRSGLIDSMGVLEVVAHLKKRYGVQVLSGEITPDHFDSLSALERYVRRKTPAS